MLFYLIEYLCWITSFILHFPLKDEETLKLVSVVFRHGDRKPLAPIELYPKDPNLNYDFGIQKYSILTESGKLRSYKLGEFLKNTYSTFLEKNYVHGNIEARSTDVNRTKETLNSVLQALYPDARIATITNPVFNDSLLLPQTCHQFLLDYLKVEDSPMVLKELLALQNFMNTLSHLTGKTIQKARDIHFIYTTLENEKFMNLPLPSWTEGIFPDGEILKGSDLQYKILNYDENLKKQGGGMLIRKFIDDMISVKQGTMNKNRKLLLYSGHDITIVAVLQNLGVYFPHVPKFSSAVILELHQIKESYFVKVVYYLGVPEEKQELKIPNCEVLCPLDKFIDLTKNLLPPKVEYLCPELISKNDDEVYMSQLPNVIKLFKIIFI